MIAVPVLILLGGGIFGYMYFMGTEEPLPSASPSASVEPTPASDLLERLFGASTVAIPVVASAKPVEDFYGLVDKTVIEARQLKKVIPDGESSGLGPLDLFERFLVTHPAGLKNTLNGEKIVMLFGQTEGFDAKGAPTVPSPALQKRLVFIVEVANQTEAARIMSEWETTMSTDLAALFMVDPGKGASPAFLDSIYNGRTIRYRNFANPDRTIDYSFVSASNGFIYLVLANSREAMYSVMDVLR